MTYTVTDHYWIVLDQSADHVYSSAARDYVPVSGETYQSWLTAGNMPTIIGAEQDLLDVLTAQAPDHLPPWHRPVPTTVTRFQARAALLGAGLLPQVEAAVAASGDAFLQLAWAEATTFSRASPTVAALAGALGLDGAALDDLFRAAGAIEA